MSTANGTPARGSPGARVFTVFREALRSFIEDDGFVMAGHLAFMGLLSLFPFLIFLVAVAGYFGQTEVGTHLVAFVLENLPESVATSLEDPIIEVMQETRGGLLTIGALGAVWTASTGLESIRTSLNRAYDVDAPPRYWRRRLESVAIVVIASAVIITGILSLVFGALLWEEARDVLDLPDPSRPIWVAARYAVSGILFLGAIAVLYWILPARRLKLRWILPGAALALVLWLASGTLFSLYLAHFSRFAVTYGSLGSVVVAMLFFYILGVVFIFGAEFNAAIARNESGSESGPRPPAGRRPDAA